MFLQEVMNMMLKKLFVLCCAVALFSSPVLASKVPHDFNDRAKIGCKLHGKRSDAVKHRNFHNRRFHKAKCKSPVFHQRNHRHGAWKKSAHCAHNKRGHHAKRNRCRR